MTGGLPIIGMAARITNRWNENSSWNSNFNENASMDTNAMPFYQGADYERGNHNNFTNLNSDMQMELTLAMLSGPAFDRAFADHMVRGHEKAIEKFENASAYLQDASLKKYADKTLPTLRKHLQLAQELQAKVGDWSDSDRTITIRCIKTDKPHESVEVRPLRNVRPPGNRRPEFLYFKSSANVSVRRRHERVVETHREVADEQAVSVTSKPSNSSTERRRDAKQRIQKQLRCHSGFAE